jgi:hypothetical protein
MTADEFVKQANSNQRSMALLEISSIYIGAQWTNDILFHDKKERVFCMNDKIIMTPEQSISIIDNYFLHVNSLKDSPVGLVYLMALQDTFPGNTHS